MFELDLKTKSIQFWNTRPDDLEKARWRIKSGEVCPFCHGHEQHLVQHDDEILLCVCVIVCFEKEQAKLYRTVSNASEFDKTLTFEMLKKRDDPRWPQMQAAIDSMKSLVASPRNHQWVLAGGSPGIGKTHLLLAVYNKITHVAIYTLAGKLADRIHDGLKREGTRPEDWQGLTDLKRLLIDVPVLLLDDLGQEHNSEFVNSMITDVIVQRYPFGRARPTVIATNLMEPAMEKRYERINDRMRDADLVLQRQIGLSSYRKLKKGSNG